MGRKVLELYVSARDDGLYSGTVGKKSNESISELAKKYEGFGFSEEEALVKSFEILRKNGFLNALRESRKKAEEVFRKPVDIFLKNHQEKSNSKEKIQEKVVDLDELDDELRDRLKKDFPDGNFIYSGTTTTSAIKILEQGAIKNGSAIEHHQPNSNERIVNNSGYEGISWSLNEIGALPGDRYHLVGFVGDPKEILKSGEVFAVPSRPAPYEVVQIKESIDPKEFYEAKNQIEIYKDKHCFGEESSVDDNLRNLASYNSHQSDHAELADFLNISQDKLESVVDKLRQLYQMQNSKIVLSPKLLQQTKEDSIPPAVVYMQALIDSDRLQHTSLSDKNLLELSNAVNPDTIKILNQMMKEDTKQYEETIDQSLQNDLDVEVNVNKTYFICPKKDLNTWLDIFSRLDEQNIPKGILTYDDKKVRLENFASLHSGDHKQLSDSIQEVMPHTPNRVDYSSLIGGKINDSMMRGYRKHVIGEEYLNHDLVLKKQDNKEGLVVA